MKKLLEYLKEYQSSSLVCYYDAREWGVDKKWGFNKKEQTIHYRELTSLTMGGACYEHRWLPHNTSVSIIISKQYGFIEWLVKNNKIDYKKLHGEEWYYKLVESCDYNGEKRCDVLLMLLSIQDEPIKFLCDIIK